MIAIFGVFLDHSRGWVRLHKVFVLKHKLTLPQISLYLKQFIIRAHSVIRAQQHGLNAFQKCYQNERKKKKNTTQDAQTKPACSTSVNNGFCSCHHYQEENMRTPARKERSQSLPLCVNTWKWCRSLVVILVSFQQWHQIIRQMTKEVVMEFCKCSSMRSLLPDARYWCDIQYSTITETPWTSHFSLRVFSWSS